MKLLFDHNLSHRIVPAIADLFDCAHVRQFGLQRETRDEVIRDFAKQHGCTIVTADRDFLRLAEMYGAPPQVIRLRAMDYPTSSAAMLIRKYALAIIEFGQSSRATLLLRKEPSWRISKGKLVARLHSHRYRSFFSTTPN